MGTPSTLYLMRHGPAESGACKADEDRRLTSEGMRAVEAAVPSLRAAGVELDFIATSPLPRALMTAEIVRDGLAPELDIKTLAALGPDHGPLPIVEALQNMTARRVLVIGHLPDVSMVAGLLTVGQASAGIGFQPGSVARIDFQGTLRPGAGILRWLLNLEMTRLPEPAR